MDNANKNEVSNRIVKYLVRSFDKYYSQSKFSQKMP